MAITINKAIEILTINLQEAGKKMHPDVRDSLFLARAALEKWKQLREGRAGIIDPLLPGEQQELPPIN